MAGQNVLVATEAPIDRSVADHSPATIVIERKSARIVPTVRRTHADIVLVDVSMPDLDGPEVLRQLTEIDPVPVVIFTRSIDDSLRQALVPRRRRSPTRSAVAALEKVLERLELTPAEMRHMADAMAADRETARPRHAMDRDAARQIGGLTVPPSRRAELEARALKRYFDERRRLLEGSLSVDQVAELLGCSRQTPHDRAKTRTLLAVADGGRLRFPPWQFDADGPDGVIEGLPAVLRALRIGALAAVRWLTHPSAVLDKRTPLATLRAGEVDRVIAEAAGVGAL
jgi:excisionase family DNA binding protein